MVSPRQFSNPRHFFIILFVSVMLAGLLVSPTAAQGGIDQWLAFGPDVQGDLPEVALVFASAEVIEIHALMPGARFGEITIAGQTYLTLSGEGYIFDGQVGAPALPVVRKMIEVPLGAKVSLELLEAKTQTVSLTGLGLQGKIAPNQPSQPKCGEPEPAAAPSAEFYGSAYYPAEQLAITDDFIIRGHRIVVVEIRPVRYSATLGELEVTSEISLRLSLSGSDMTRTNSEADRLNSAPFNQILQPTVLNYNQDRPLASAKPVERILIITADMFQADLADFVTLKESQGFTTSVVNLTTVGGNTTASIKNYIKTQYLGANPPDYVILVGDYYPGNAADLTNWNFRTDSGFRTDLHYYTMDSETEFVPDIFGGRFPVRTVSQLTAMIDKYLAYQDLSGVEPWIKKAEFLASNDGSYYDVAEASHNYVINSYTLPHGYTGIFPNNPQPGGDKIYAITYGGTGAHAVASMNDDRSFIVYSGHGASTFWDAPRVNQTDIRNMTGEAISYVASHACVTADFNTGESFGDTWVIEPVNGGLTFFGASDNSYWDQDDVLERTVFDTLYADPELIDVPSVGSMTHAGLLQVDAQLSMGNYYWEEYHIFGDPSLVITMGPKYPDFRINADPTAIKTCNDGSNSASVNVTSINDYVTPVNLTASPQTGFTTTFANNPVIPPSSTTATIGGNGTAATGSQTLVLTGTAGDLIHTAQIELSIFAPILSGPELLTPANNAKDVSPRPTFTWTPVANAETYQLQVSADAAFSQIVFDRAGIVGTSFTLTMNLATDTQYYWRVYAENICGDVISTQAYAFRTSPGAGDCGEGTVKQEIFFDSFEGGLGAWQNPGDTFKFDITTVRAYSPVSSVLASVPETQSDQRFISPAFTVPNTTEPVSLIFWHRWTFDSPTACNDGAILEATINGGTTWNQVAKSYLLTNAYNGSIRSGEYNPLAGRQAWCYGTDEWVRTVVQLSPYKGKTVQFRFRMGTGTSGAAEGWYIDDVLLLTCVANTQSYKIFLPSVLAGN
ncbi:MAG TPA: C25 family cysteine peptidase [Anaerolineaceae bacterium]|nr:C25 family cysteine peptidase [Anaerolineaceae bacterium]